MSTAINDLYSKWRESKDGCLTAVDWLNLHEALDQNEQVEIVELKAHINRLRERLEIECGDRCYHEYNPCWARDLLLEIPAQSLRDHNKKERSKERKLMIRMAEHILVASKNKSPHTFQKQTVKFLEEFINNSANNQGEE